MNKSKQDTVTPASLLLTSEMITNSSKFFPFILFLCLLSLYPSIAQSIRINNGLRMKEVHVSTAVISAQLNARSSVPVPSPLGTTRMSKRKVRRGSNPIHNKN
jgi:hypothetical protein